MARKGSTDATKFWHSDAGMARRRSTDTTRFWHPNAKQWPEKDQRIQQDFGTQTQQWQATKDTDGKNEPHYQDDNKAIKPEDHNRRNNNNKKRKLKKAESRGTLLNYELNEINRFLKGGVG